MRDRNNCHNMRIRHTNAACIYVFSCSSIPDIAIGALANVAGRAPYSLLLLSFPLMMKERATQARIWRFNEHVFKGRGAVHCLETSSIITLTQGRCSIAQHRDVQQAFIKATSAVVSKATMQHAHQHCRCTARHWLDKCDRVLRRHPCWLRHISITFTQQSAQAIHQLC